MAVNSTATFHRYKPGSAQLPEALPGIVFSALDDIDVFLENADGGASQPLTLGVHYSLALPSEHSDGTITAIGTYDADDVFHVERNSRIDQPTVFDPFQVVPGRAVERGLDRNALWAQEAQREISRSLRMQRGLPTLEVGAIEEGDAVGLINGRLRGFSNTVAAATSAAAIAAAGAAAVAGEHIPQERQRANIAARLYHNELHTTARADFAPLPFEAGHDESGTWSEIAGRPSFLRDFIANAWVYGEIDDYRIGYIEIKQARRRISIVRQRDDRTVAQWIDLKDLGREPTPADIPEFVICNQFFLPLDGDSGWEGLRVVLHLVPSALLVGEGPYATMSRGGIDRSRCFTSEYQNDYAETEHSDYTLTVGAGQSFGSIGSALAHPIAQSAFYHRQVTVLVSPGTFIEEDLVVPPFVTVRGSGEATIVTNSAGVAPCFQLYNSSRLLDMKVESLTGDGGANVGQYCVHSDPFGPGELEWWGGTRRQNTVFQRVARVWLYTGPDQNTQALGCGTVGGQHMVVEDVVVDRANPAANNADISFHNSAKYDPGRNDGYAEAIAAMFEPSIVEVRNCRGASLGVGADLQVVSLVPPTQTRPPTSTLLVSGNAFATIKFELTAAVQHQWAFAGILGETALIYQATA